MTEILNCPPQLSSHSRSITCATPTITDNDAVSQQTYNNSLGWFRRNENGWCTQILGVEDQEEGEKEDQLSVLAVFVTVFRKSLVGCTSVGVEEQLMEIGVPTNVTHVAHVTFDRFDGFLGLPAEFEPEVPRRPPSASVRVFGVSAESMQLSFDSRGNCIPTILLMMQRRLYLQGGLQSEGIFRINAENGQEEFVREQLNNGMIPENIDVHCLAGLIKAWFRELPKAILDSLSPEQVMQAHSEDECSHLVRLLPPTEAALLDWAINLMADVAQLECLNKMNARNIAMVFAPNMTHMSDPLTALMYVVQVMKILQALVVKTIRAREDLIEDAGHSPRLKPSDEDADQGTLGISVCEAVESSQDEQVFTSREPLLKDAISNSICQAEEETSYATRLNSCSIEKILPNTSPRILADRLQGEHDNVVNGRNQLKNQRVPKGGLPGKLNIIKKETRKPAKKHAVVHAAETANKSKELSITRNLNSQTERVESWR